MTRKKTIGYKNFIIGIYKKVNNIITLTESFEESSYRTACSVWKKKRLENINEWSIVGMKCVTFDDDFNIRFLSSQGGASDSDLPNDSIFSKKTLINDSNIHSQTTNIVNSENLNEGENIIDASNICKKPINKTTENKKVSNDMSPEQELLIKIKDRHISDVNINDIGEILVTYWNLLKDKSDFCQDLYSYYSKERDCSIHKLENIGEIEFNNNEEEIQFQIDTSNEIIYYSNKRRDSQNEYNLCKSYADKFKTVDSSTIKNITLVNSKNNKKKYINSPNLRTYTYTYSTLDEKNTIMKNADKKHDKVIDFSPGVIKCYNKCYSIHKNCNYEEINDLIHNEDTNENIENINNNGENIILKYGDKIPRTHGSSVTIKELSKKAIIHFEKHLNRKYQSSIVENNSITLINRIKS